MPGIRFAGPRAGAVGPPDIRPYLLANSLTGAGTPPAAAVQAGDLVALTQVAALTSGGNTVVRMLLAADVTAHYKEGTPVAGILGVAMWSVQSNSTGVATAPPALGGITTNAAINYPLSGSGLEPADDATGRSQLAVAVASGNMTFAGRLYTGGGAITLQHQYDGLLAGFNLSTTAGVTTYTVNVGAAAADQCIRIIGPNVEDPLYNTLVANGAASGCEIFFEFIAAFDQADTGVVYSTQ